MAYCGQCGAPVTDRFCGICGAPTGVEQNSEAAPTIQASWNAAPAATQQLPLQPVSPPSSPPAPPNRRGPLWAIAGGALAAALVVGFVVLRGQGDTGTTATPEPTPVTSEYSTPEYTPSPEQSPEPDETPGPSETPDPYRTPTAPAWTPSASPTSNPSAAAAAELSRQRSVDFTRAQVDGRWIAQVASKYDGVVDRTQTTAGGGHTFRLADILAEHQTLRARFEGQGYDVLLLKSTDFGRQRGTTRTIWVTVVDPDLRSSAAVVRWCKQRFPGRTTKQVANLCFPRQLQQPY